MHYFYGIELEAEKSLPKNQTDFLPFLVPLKQHKNSHWQATALSSMFFFNMLILVLV